MDYTIDYMPDKNIVVIQMKGRLNFQIAEQYSREAVKLARQNNCTKFLLNHTETEIRAAVNKFHTTGHELQQFGFKSTDRIAIVVTNLASHSNLLKPENKNNTWCNFNYFDAVKIEKAYKWLTGLE
ncbi:MAG: hypothetical protein KJ799_14395 [Bacteroidetes bacterium]|nr:hypothetical protein [Bacteroidota bacterium]MBU1680090.1 hypothetical protein [Bacteroidota bacterium]MBU2507895.1 hypothetical protein [Bacteroidota bacterium]